jgi:hypothetical protein
MRRFVIAAFGAVGCAAGVALHGAGRPAAAAPGAAPGAAPAAAETELVAVYVGSDGLHADSAFRAAVREMNARLRARQQRAGRRFVSVGASLAPGAEAARADLATVGPFDELALGEVVRNAVTTRYGVTGAPEVVLVERPVSRLPLALGAERVVARIAGTAGVVAWVRAGVPVPAGRE